MRYKNGKSFTSPGLWFLSPASLAVFYLTSIVLGGFSSLFAYALTLLNGKRGLAGWQWIFIIEGIITIVLGVLTFFFVPDFPDKNTFLTKEQTKVCRSRSPTVMFLTSSR